MVEKSTSKPKVETPKATKAEKTPYTLPTDVLDKGKVHIDSYVDSFTTELGMRSKGRVTRLHAVKALREVWPTFSTADFAKYLAGSAFSKLPAEFKRESTSELSPLLNILANANVDKLANGWNDVDSILMARGWNATVKELQLSGVMPKPKPRQSTPRPGIQTRTEIPAGGPTNAIPLSDPADACRKVQEWFTKFRVVNFPHGVADVHKNPVLAKMFADLCKLAQEEYVRINALREVAGTEKATGQAPYQDEEKAA